MPKRNCSTKIKTTTPESEQIYKGATKASYFVLENRDISPNELKQFELMLGTKNTTK